MRGRNALIRLTGRCLWALIALAYAFPASAAKDLVFEIPVLQDMKRHDYLLTMPGIVALALENNELYPSVSNPLSIPDRATAKIRYGSLTFVAKRESVYEYRVTISGFLSMSFDFPVHLDLGNLAGGKVVLTLSPPLSGLIPDELVQRIDFKLRALLNDRAQRRLLDYFEKKAAQARSTGRGQDAVVESIALEAYSGHRRPVALLENSSLDSPLTAVVMVGALIVAWFLLYPVFVLVLRSRQRLVK